MIGLIRLANLPPPLTPVRREVLQLATFSGPRVDGARRSVVAAPPSLVSALVSQRGVTSLLCIVLVGIGLTAALETTAASETNELPDFDKLWNYSDLDSTEIRFRAILPAARRSGDDEYTAQLLTQIARTQGLQRRFAEAHVTLDEVQKMLSETTPIANVRYLLERGRAHNSSGAPEKAKPLFEKALDAAQSAHADYYAVDAAHMMAIVEPPPAALEWNLRAIKLAEEASDERARGWLGSLYNNTGWSLHDMERYAEALDIFQKALTWRRERQQAAETRTAQWCVARTLRSLGRVEEALVRQRELQAEFDSLGEQDGYVFEELGECLLALDRADESREHFARAYANLSQNPWMVENESERLDRLRELGASR